MAVRVKVLLTSAAYLVITAPGFAHEGHEGPEPDPFFEFWMVIPAVAMAAAAVVAGIRYWWYRGGAS
jgi:hypothetical protein